MTLKESEWRKGRLCMMKRSQNMMNSRKKQRRRHVPPTLQKVNKKENKKNLKQTLTFLNSIQKISIKDSMRKHHLQSKSLTRSRMI